MESNNDFIYTQVGKFTLDAPEFRPEAIAHSLAQVPRWAGHTDRNVTCAEHACFVAGVMAVSGHGNPLEGLLADAPDAYMGHMARPWRQRFPDYVAAWTKLDRAIRAKWNLPLDKTSDCTRADQLALLVEAYVCFPDHGFDIPDVHGLRAEAISLVKSKWRLHGITQQFPWQFWDHLWMKAYHEYSPKIEIAQGDAEMQAIRAKNGDKAEGHAVVVA